MLQQLISNKDMVPFYWNAEKSEGEIDFVFQSGIDIIPPEVKAAVNLPLYAVNMILNTLNRTSIVLCLYGFLKRGKFFLNKALKFSIFNALKIYLMCLKMEDRVLKININQLI